MGYRYARACARAMGFTVRRPRQSGVRCRPGAHPRGRRRLVPRSVGSRGVAETPEKKGGGGGSMGGMPDMGDMGM